MLGRNVVMNAVYLTLEQAPDAFNAVDMDRTPAIFALAVVHRKAGVWAVVQSLVCEVLVGQKNGAISHVVEHSATNRFAVQFLDGFGPDFSVALQHAEHNGFAVRSADALAALVLVLVAFFAAEQGFVKFNGPG